MFVSNTYLNSEHQSIPKQEHL